MFTLHPSIETQRVWGGGGEEKGYLIQNHCDDDQFYCRQMVAMHLGGWIFSSVYRLTLLWGTMRMTRSFRSSFQFAYLGSSERLSFSLVSRWPSVAPDGHHSAGGGHWWHWWHRHRPPPPPITLIAIPDSELQEFAVFLPRRRTGTTSLKNTCSPPNGPTSTQPGILRPFSVDINKPAAFHTQTLLSERRPRPRPADNLTPFSLSRVGQSGSYLWLPLPDCQVGEFHKLVVDYADRLSALHSTQCAAGAPLIRWTSLPALWLTEQ